MNKLGHWIVGAVTSGIILAALGLTNDYKAILVAIPITLVYSVLPDIDHQSSWINNRAEKGLALGVVGFMIGGIYFYDKMLWTGLIMACVLAIIQFLRHRGITHTLKIGLLASLPLLAVGWQYAAIAGAAYASHLIVDKEIRL